jgi:hypothetical protein
MARMFWEEDTIFRDIGHGKSEVFWQSGRLF